jgi:hypothetical protein
MAHYDDFVTSTEEEEYFAHRGSSIVNPEWEAYVDNNLPEQQQSNKYLRTIKGVQMDVYDVLKGFNVQCPAMQHAIKKMLCSGLRGHKGTVQDKEEAIASIKRSIELEG